MFSASTGVIKCKKDSGNIVNCATCVSPQLLNNSQVFQLRSEQLDCKRPSIESPLKTGEISQWEDTEPDLPYIKDLEPPLGHLTFALSDSHGNVAHVACEMSRPTESTSVVWETLKSSGVMVNVTLMSLLECDIDRDELHNMWRLIAYYYESPALLDRGAKHENTSQVSFQYSQAVNEDSSYFTDLKGHIMAEPSWLLQPRITLQLNRRKTTSKKLVLNFSTFLTSHKASHDKDVSSWAVIQRGMATQIQSASKGSNVTFECNVHSSGQQQVEWMHPDLTLLEKTDSENIVTEDNKIHINNVTVSDSGLYHCIVKTEMDVDTVFFRLAVRERQLSPSALNGKKISVESGSVLSLDCSVSSPHPSEISWYLPNSKILTTSQPKGRVSMLQNNTLVITDVSHSDAGIYSCLAMNLYGVDMLSHLLVVTNENTEEKEKVRINESELPLAEIEIENEGSGYEEIEYPLPKQPQQTFHGKERGSVGTSRGVKGDRGKHSSRKGSTSIEEMASSYKEKVNVEGPSLPPYTQITTMESQRNVTHTISTTTTVATIIAVMRTDNVDEMNSTGLEKHVSKLNQADTSISREHMKTINHHSGDSDSPGESNDTWTRQSKSERTRSEINLRDRFNMNSNLTQIWRRRRPPLRRPYPNRYSPDSNRDKTTNTSINITRSKTTIRDHTNLARRNMNRNGKHRSRNRDVYSPATTKQSYNELTNAGEHTTNTVINYTTKYVTFSYDRTTLVSKKESNVYPNRKNVKDTKNEHINSKNINTKINDSKQKPLIITSTTFSPRKHETTINIPLSPTAETSVGITAQPTVTKPILYQKVKKVKHHETNSKHHDITRHITSTPDTIPTQPWIQRQHFWERHPLAPTQRPNAFAPTSGYPGHFPSHASTNFQQWNFFVTSQPEITSRPLRLTTSIHHTINGRTVAPHPTLHPSSSSAKDFLRLSRLRNRYRQSRLNFLSLKFGRLVTPKPRIIKPTPRPEQAPKMSSSFKPITPPPTSTATTNPYSTASMMYGSQWYDRYARSQKLSTAVSFPDLMASGFKPQISSMNTVVVSAPPETDVYLPCQAIGHPQPTISWKKVSSGEHEEQLIIILKTIRVL